MRNKLSVLLMFLFVFFGMGAKAQIELPTDKVSWKISVEQKDDIATVTITITCVDHWHINATKMPAGSFGFPTGFELKKSPDFSLKGGIIEPKPIEKFDELADEQLAYHQGTFKLKRKIKVLSESDFKLKGTFSFQTCNEVKCLPTHYEDFEVEIKGFKKEIDDSQELESDLKINGDFAVDKNGNNFVLFKEKWVAVPKENSPKFYKKYLELGGDVK